MAGPDPSQGLWRNDSTATDQDEERGGDVRGLERILDKETTAAPICRKKRSARKILEREKDIFLCGRSDFVRVMTRRVIESKRSVERLS